VCLKIEHKYDKFFLGENFSSILYFKRTNFREQKLSRFSWILAFFAKVNVFKNSKQGNSQKFMLAKNSWKIWKPINLQNCNKYQIVIIFLPFNAFSKSKNSRFYQIWVIFVTFKSIFIWKFSFLFNDSRKFMLVKNIFTSNSLK